MSNDKVIGLQIIKTRGGGLLGQSQEGSTEIMSLKNKYLRIQGGSRNENLHTPMCRHINYLYLV